MIQSLTGVQIKYLDTDDNTIKRGIILDKILVWDEVYNRFLFFTWTTTIAVTHYLIQPEKEEEVAILSPFDIKAVLTKVTL